MLKPWMNHSWNIVTRWWLWDVLFRNAAYWLTLIWRSEGVRAAAAWERLGCAPQECARVSCEWPRRKLSLKWDFRGTIGEHKRTGAAAAESRAEQQPAFASRPRLSVSTSSRQHRSAADLLHRVRPPPSHAHTNARLSVSTFRSPRSSSQQSTKILSDVGSRRPLTRPELCFHHVSKRGSPARAITLRFIENLRQFKTFRHCFRNIAFLTSACEISRRWTNTPRIKKIWGSYFQKLKKIKLKMVFKRARTLFGQLDLFT